MIHLLIHSDKKTNQEVNKHGTFLLPYDIYRTCIPQFFTCFPMHWHEELEIVYVQNGRAVYMIDFETYIVEQGDILIIPPASLHSFEQYHNESFNAATIIFSQNMINGNLVDICSAKYIVPIFQNEIYLTTYIPKADVHNQPLAEYMLHAVQEHINRDTAYELRIRIDFLNIIQYCFQQQLYTKVKRSVSSTRTMAQIKTITNYIEEHYADKITLEDLAALANISVYHLSHIFKNCTGQSPNEYLNFYRLTKAANKLTSEDTPILTIAIECGYNNISYFNRVFKRRYGITPKAYRQKYLTTHGG